MDENNNECKAMHAQHTISNIKSQQSFCIFFFSLAATVYYDA